MSERIRFRPRITIFDLVAFINFSWNLKGLYNLIDDLDNGMAQFDQSIILLRYTFSDILF